VKETEYSAESGKIERIPNGQTKKKKRGVSQGVQRPVLENMIGKKNGVQRGRGKRERCDAWT